MNNHDDQQSGTRFLADLATYAFDTNSLPSNEGAVRILKDAKIDTSDLKSWAAERLRGARARQKLAEAAAKREAMAEMFAAVKARLGQGTGGLRDRVLEKLKVLQNSSPDTALVYCRKFENAPDEDLPGLEAELLMLEEWDEEAEK